MKFLGSLLMLVPVLADKVQVQVMVESYCPCSGAWEHAFSEEMSPLIGDIVEVTRFFDAKATGTQACCNPSTADASSCMHTLDECVADSLQRCVQEHYPKWEDWLSYSSCIIGDCDDRPAVLGCKTQMDVGRPKNLALEQQCAKSHEMDWGVISECWTGPEGVKLMQSDADKSDAVDEGYGLQGLPVVWVDGELFSVFFDCNNSKPEYQKELISKICKSSTADPLPLACKQLLD